MASETAQTQRIAIVQMDPQLGSIETNLASMAKRTAEAAGDGAGIVLFPECALQGIVFDDKTSAHKSAEPSDASAVWAMVDLAKEHDVALVFGFIEQRGEEFANSAAVALPDGSCHFYRKTHLTELGADRWAEKGDALSDVFEFRGLRFGVIICYDVRFPEVSRVLALKGLDAILMPTNSPVGYEGTYDHAARTRAWENRVWVLVANRVGVEGDATFIGRSLAVDPFGMVVAQAGGTDEEVLLVDVDVEQARSKLLPGHGGEEYSFLDARRPDLYGELVEGEGAPRQGRTRGARLDTAARV